MTEPTLIDKVQILSQSGGLLKVMEDKLAAYDQYIADFQKLPTSQRVLYGEEYVAYVLARQNIFCQIYYYKIQDEDYKKQIAAENKQYRESLREVDDKTHTE